MTTPKKIVLADDDEALLSALAIRCRSLKLEVLTANDGVSALRLITAEPPDLACLDFSMPGITGLTLCESLMLDKRFSSMPIIILTGQPGRDVVQRCHKSAAYYVPKCADVWPRIEPLLVELLELDVATREETAIAAPDPPEASRGGSQPCVLSIDDDDDVSRSLKLRLAAHGVMVLRSAAGVEGYRRAFRCPVDAIILDYNLPDGRGDYVLRRLKENPLTKDVPVIVVTGVHDHGIERTLWNLGAAAYLTKPLDFAKLLAELGNHIDMPDHALAERPKACVD
jgi:two-component system response regulator MprA